MKQILLIIMVVFVGCSTGIKKATPVVDLSVTPETTLTPEFHEKSVKLHGVGLGDSESDIPHDLVVTEGNTWISLVDGGGAYRVKKGKVIALKLPDSVARTLPIESEKDLINLYGKPDKKIEFEFPIKAKPGFVMCGEYQYLKLGLEFDWIDWDNGFTFQIKVYPKIALEE